MSMLSRTTEPKTRPTVSIPLLNALAAAEIPAAVSQLVRWQIIAKIKSAFRRAMTRRRLPLTLGAAFLGMLWLIQAVAGVLYRSPAAPQQLQKWIPISLCCYFLWNVLKTFGQTPIEPFNWNGSEREWLLSSPLRRSQVIRYRGSAIIRAAFFKSMVFAVVMSPDLQLMIYGFMGIFLGLMFIDVSRLIMEMIAYGLSPKELRYCRGFVFGSATVVAGSALLATLCSLEQATNSHAVATFGILLHLMSELVTMTDTWFGKIALSPFTMVTDLILSAQYTTKTLTRLVVASCSVLAMAVSIPAIDRFFTRRRDALDIARFADAQQQQRIEQSKPIRLTAKVPARLGGISPLAWRQSFGAVAQAKPLCVSLLIPHGVELPSDPHQRVRHGARLSDRRFGRFLFRLVDAGVDAF